MAVVSPLFTPLIAWLSGQLAAAPSIPGEYGTSLAQEKIQIRNLKFGFYRMRIALAPSPSQKLYVELSLSQGPSVFLNFSLPLQMWQEMSL